jgi:hypothetical protein
MDHLAHAEPPSAAGPRRQRPTVTIVAHAPGLGKVMAMKTPRATIVVVMGALYAWNTRARVSRSRTVLSTLAD